MGELESLLVVLALIYLSECLVWVGRGAVAFASWTGKRFRPRFPGSVMGNTRGGFLFSKPLPPLGIVLLNQPFPVSISSATVFACSSTCLNSIGRPEQTARLLRLDDLRDITTVGRELRVNGALLLKAISPFTARHIAGVLNRLHKLPEPDRAAAVRTVIEDSLDADAVSKRFDEYRARSRRLRVLSNVLFVYLFLLVPPLLWQFGFGKFGLGLLAGMLAQSAVIAVLFRRAHATLYPGADEERFKPFLTMMLAPPAAIRAADILARHLVENAHPLAVARALSSPETFRRLSRQVLIDLRHPLLPVCPTRDALAAETEEQFRTMMHAAVSAFVRKSGLNPDELTAAPQPAESGNQSYCPRCGAQFLMIEGVCRDCGDRPLEPFQDGALG